MRKILYFLFFLALLGFVLSVISIVQTQKEATTGDSGFCISEDDACGSVLTSKYSSFLGISLGKWGVIYYLFVIVLLLVSAQEWLGDENSKQLFYLVTIFGSAFSIYLIIIMSFVIKSVCTTCLTSHLANLLMSGTIIYQLLKHKKVY